MANDDLQHCVPIEVESSLFDWAESKEDHVNPSICMVPNMLRNLSPDSFKPQLVSIGPLHKEDPNVQDIERLKRSYLYDLLQRPTSTPKPPKTKLEECLQKVIAKIGEIRSSYSSTTKYSDAQLADMMVMDGCFILEFCWKDYLDEEQTLLNQIQTDRIAIDLMLLENQIPFFVLQYIFDLTKPKDKSELDVTLLLQKVLSGNIHPFNIFQIRDESKVNLPKDESKVNFPKDESKVNFPKDESKVGFPKDFSVPDNSKIDPPEHVLDCLHQIYKFRPSDNVDDSCAMCEWTLCKHVWNMCGLRSCLSKNSDKVNAHHSVVELESSGVNFEPQKEKQKGMYINFVKASSYVLGCWRKRTLVMPTLIIQDYTEVVLRNFIAYEQLFPKENYFFTSYSFFMDRLINNAADVGKLVESGVLINNLGSHKEAATVINSICKNINVDQLYYEKQIQELDEYYNSFWPNSFANLRRTYFNNPWSVFALLGAIALFGLTVVQTIYTVMSFYP